MLPTWQCHMQAAADRGAMGGFRHASGKPAQLARFQAFPLAFCGYADRPLQALHHQAVIAPQYPTPPQLTSARPCSDTWSAPPAAKKPSRPLRLLMAWLLSGGGGGLRGACNTEGKGC